MTEILEAADSIMVSLINPDELHSGLVRLTQGGLITKQDQKFLPSDKIPIEFLNPNQNCNYNSMLSLAKHLNVEKPPVKHFRDSRNNLRYPGLTQDKIDKAMSLYRKRALSHHNKNGDL